MDPWASWAVVLAGGGAAWYYYYYSQGQQGANARRGRNISTKEAKKLHTAQEKQKREAGQSGSDTQINPTVAKEAPKRRKTQKNVNQGGSNGVVESSTAPAVEVDDAEDEGMDNKEFARQLAGVTKGSTLAPQPEKKAKRRTNKQKHAADAADSTVFGENAEASATTSSAGGDADDDLSPAVSPALVATNGKGSAEAGVSDMLEAPAPGPSVLRLTEPTQPQREPRAPRQKSVEQVETKKQRQNRRKNEEKKAAREEAEAERRVLLEKQRRTAREAEGRPAKNGLGPTKPPAQSVWSKPQNITNGNAASHPPPPPPTMSGDLLDTFDSTTQASKPATSQKKWSDHLPSEEEQMRILAESDESAWSVVGKKPNKKKTSVSVNDDTTSPEGSEVNVEPVKVSAPPVVAPKPVTAKADPFDGKPFSVQGSSEW